MGREEEAFDLAMDQLFNELSMGPLGTIPVHTLSTDRWTMRWAT